MFTQYGKNGDSLNCAILSHAARLRDLLLLQQIQAIDEPSFDEGLPGNPSSRGFLIEALDRPGRQIHSHPFILRLKIIQNAFATLKFLFQIASRR